MEVETECSWHRHDGQESAWGRGTGQDINNLLVGPFWEQCFANDLPRDDDDSLGVTILSVFLPIHMSRGMGSISVCLSVCPVPVWKKSANVFVFFNQGSNSRIGYWQKPWSKHPMNNTIHSRSPWPLCKGWCANVWNFLYLAIIKYWCSSVSISICFNNNEIRNDSASLK